MRVPFMAVAGLIVSALASVAAVTVPNERAPIEWARLRDPQVRVAVDVPTTWLFETTQPYGRMAEFRPDSSGNLIVDFGQCEPTNMSQYLSFDRWIREEVSRLRRQGKILKQEQIRVGSLRAARIEALSRVPRPAYLIYTYVGVPERTLGPDGGVMFVMVLQAPTEAKARPHLAIYDRMLSSLEVLPEPR